jgi:Replicative DNA helicase
LTGVPTGYTQLDEMTSGWQQSDLVIIAGRPAMIRINLLMILFHANSLTHLTRTVMILD